MSIRCSRDSEEGEEIFTMVDGQQMVNIFWCQVKEKSILITRSFVDESMLNERKKPCYHIIIRHNDVFYSMFSTKLFNFKISHMSQYNNCPNSKTIGGNYWMTRWGSLIKNRRNWGNSCEQKQPIYTEVAQHFTKLTIT